MKFGKRLQSQIEETMPEWRDKFLSYKQLKKRLKLIAAPHCFTDAAAFDSSSNPPVGKDDQSRASVVDVVDEEHRRGREVEGPAAGAAETLLHAESQEKKQAVEENKTCVESSLTKFDVEIPQGGAGTCLKDVDKCRHSEVLDGGDAGGLWSSSEMEFVRLLNKELRKFNQFFIEKEEDYVIRLQELKDRIESVKRQRGANHEDPPQEDIGDDEVLRIFRDIVTVHGEMVLLENYSSLNYTGLVKILKKHDKRTGAVLRMPYIQSVMLQPFFTTELISKLVQECERNLQSLFPGPLETSILPTQDHPGSPFDIFNHLQDSSCEAVETIHRSTLTALRTIQHIRQGSSMQSIFPMLPVDPFKKENPDKAVIKDRTNTVVAVTQ